MAPLTCLLVRDETTNGCKDKTRCHHRAIESLLKTKSFTPPDVTAVLVRQRTNGFSASVGVIDNVVHRSLEPAWNVAISKDMPEEYSLLVLVPGQKCQIEGRREVRFFPSAGSSSSVTNSQSPNFRTAFALPFSRSTGSRSHHAVSSRAISCQTSYP